MRLFVKNHASSTNINRVDRRQRPLCIRDRRDLRDAVDGGAHRLPWTRPLTLIRHSCRSVRLCASGASSSLPTAQLVTGLHLTHDHGSCGGCRAAAGAALLRVAAEVAALLADASVQAAEELRSLVAQRLTSMHSANAEHEAMLSTRAEVAPRAAELLSLINI